MSIDVEGMDTEVLRTHDWNVLPTIIAVEGMMGDSSHMYLLEKGYSFVGLTGLTMIFKK